jgi:signal transduction histidine kinase
MAAADSMHGWSSFENLFQTSPVPLMEQDYSALLRWMAELRASGVDDITEYIAGDVERVRAMVPMVRIIAANPAAVKAVGLPAEQLIGPIDPAIVNDGALDGWIAQFDAVWSGRPVARASILASTATGETYDAESILSAPLIDGRPDYSRAVFTLTDVTTHRAEERRMVEVVEAKNDFLASVSHEIRTPLTALLGFARLLADSDSLGDDDRKVMTSAIVQQAMEMADLVDDLLVAARTEMGQIEVLVQRMEILEHVRTTLAAGGSFCERVRLVESDGEFHATGDPSRVRQILRNLLTNAERYGGPTVTVAVRRDGSNIVIEVADDGPGLPSSDWERVFELYQRAHQNKGQPGSVGIGLAISRQLAELMGGSLDYRYEAGTSRFRLQLPSA